MHHPRYIDGKGLNLQLRAVPQSPRILLIVSHGPQNGKVEVGEAIKPEQLHFSYLLCMLHKICLGCEKKSFSLSLSLYERVRNLGTT